MSDLDFLAVRIATDLVYEILDDIMECSVADFEIEAMLAVDELGGFDQFVNAVHVATSVIEFDDELRTAIVVGDHLSFPSRVHAMAPVLDYCSALRKHVRDRVREDEPVADEISEPSVNESV